VNALIAESPAPSRSWRDVLIVAAGLTGTAGLLGFVTGDVLPPLAFAGGAMILAGAIRGGLACGPNPKASNSPRQTGRSHMPRSSILRCDRDYRSRGATGLCQWPLYRMVRHFAAAAFAAGGGRSCTRR
jgi:hypothetical protein